MLPTKSLFASFALFATIGTVHADDFGLALQQLASKPVVRAQFQQSKQIANVTKPMVSTGQLLFVKNQGVLWQIQRPVKANLVVSPAKMVQKTERTQTVVNLKQTPYGPAANVLLQLMSGNESALKQNFQVASFKRTGTSWQASLIPQTSTMKQLFARIEVEGGAYVQRLNMVDAQNRSTQITFSQHATTPATLSTAENALFKLAK